MKKFIKQKEEEQMGFKTPNFIRQNKFGGSKSFNQKSFNPAQFKTQHKG